MAFLSELGDLPEQVVGIDPFEGDIAVLLDRVHSYKVWEEWLEQVR
jgi:hypothetical protein